MFIETYIFKFSVFHAISALSTPSIRPIPHKITPAGYFIIDLHKNHDNYRNN